jgi:hypothetical protein
MPGEDGSSQGDVDPYALARIHLALGSSEEAFQALSQAITDGVGYLPRRGRLPRRTCRSSGRNRRSLRNPLASGRPGDQSYAPPKQVYTRSLLDQSFERSTKCPLESGSVTSAWGSHQESFSPPLLVRSSR